ncbi:hypothetical protein OF83DRAFT_1084456 [Amylostereum chailletii]|nr:hypothetical protein OF83DRAFT_1084456 [Amylostereum chailletii]
MLEADEDNEASVLLTPPPTPPKLTGDGRPIRGTRGVLPRRFEDDPPAPSSHLPPPDVPPPLHLAPEVVAPTVPEIQTLDSPVNVFGLFRRYRASTYPVHDPDANIQREELVDEAPRVLIPCPPPHDENSDAPSSSSLQPAPANSISALWPFPNRSAFEYSDWYWTGGSQKTIKAHDDLIYLFNQDWFKPSDVANALWSKINKLLVEEQPTDADDGWEDDVAEASSWKDTPICFAVPLRSGEEGYLDYDAGTLRHRNLTSVIRDKLRDDSCHRSFHYEPYEHRWQAMASAPSERVHGELYTSDAFIEAHKKLQATQFGNAKMWPFYTFKPSANLCEHVAYFQSLPDEFKDFILLHTGAGPSQQLDTHCKHEMYHAQLRILLDEEFMVAYEHGIVVLCPDGIHRCFYPRLFTYSADYPEKLIQVSETLSRRDTSSNVLYLIQVSEML